MNIFKPSVLLLICGLVSKLYSADLPKDLVKKVLKATAEYQNYDIVFNRSFKYPLEKDTLIETYQSSVFTQNESAYIGWHAIKYKRSGTPRSLAASNGSEVCRMNYKEQLHFCQDQNQAEKFSENLKAYLYTPLYLNKEELNKFSLASESKEYYELNKTDTTKDNKGRVTHISKTILKIDRSSYLPVSEITLISSGTRLQYSAYELVQINQYNQFNIQKIKTKADSFLNVIRAVPNGDSVKAARKDLYKKLKIGDTAYMFTANTHDGKPFDLSHLKDSVIVLDFFYTTCKPCISALPELNAIYRNLSAQGVTVVGVNAFSTDWDNLNTFVNDHHIIYPIVKTSKQVLYEYGVTGFPRLIVIRNGIVVKVYFGYAKGMEQELQKLLDELKK